MKQLFFFLSSILIAPVLLSQTIGIQLAYIDSSYSPRNDFYNYANGKWLKTQKIPASESFYGSFQEINDRNLMNIRNILDIASKDSKAAPGSNAQKLRDFYLCAMDSVKTEKDGINPIKPQLAQIDAVKTTDDVIKLCASFKKWGIVGFMTADVDIDMKNSNKNRVYIAQTGFGMPDRDYYYLPQFESVRGAYLTHLKNMFVLLNFYPESAETYAKKVFEIEKQLALKSMNSQEQRDVKKLYNVYSGKQLKELTPAINWDLFFSTQGLKMPDSLIVAQPLFYSELNTIFKNTSVDDWKMYFKLKLAQRAGPFLTPGFEKEMFNFFGKTLNGATQMKPRWKRSQNNINAFIGEILGKAYVEKYFNKEAKDKVKNMVENLIASYRERIATRTWMGEDTKKQANLKLDKLIKKFGYPDNWKDYSTLAIKRDSYWQNTLRASEYEYKRGLAKLNKPVDKTEWQMTPPTVNAYYNPTINEIVFPAGIMQVPFFDYTADDAFNYGVMGSIIGHELTHGFDDQGSQFDADGNLKMWWSEQDFKNFLERTQVVINQFNKYIAIDTLHVNGTLTQGENIADLGGLTMAYYAYKKSLNGKKSPVMSGFTGEQRFFIAWAQGWKSLSRPEFMKQLISTNPHAPGEFRGFAPLTNLKEFYEAFGVKEGDKMYTAPEKRAEVW